MLDLEEEFWADPRNRPQYDPDTLETAYPKEGPPIPDEDEAAALDEAEVPTTRRPLPVPDELPQASAPIASADPSFRPPPVDAGTAGPAFDVRRALSRLFGGREGLSDYDRQKLQEAMQASKSKQDAQELELKTRKDRREQEAHDALVPKKAEKLAAETAGIGAKNALADPSSPQSKSAVNMMLARLESRAATMEDGTAKNHLLKFVQDARSEGSQLNAIEAAKWSKYFGADASDIIREHMAERKQTETEAMGVARREDIKADNAREDAKLAARKAAAAAKVNAVAQKVHLTGDQHKLVSEIAEGMMNGNEIDELIPIAEKYANESSDLPGMGKTGVISGRVQSLKSMTNATSDPEYNKFASALARLYSVERKTFAGVAVTPTEMENLRPFMPDLKKDSEQTVLDKLRDGRRKLDAILTARMGQLNYDAKGNPIDPSLIARLLSDVAPDAAATNKQIQRMRGGKPAAALPGQTVPPPSATPGKVSAPAGSKPGQVIRQKSTGKTFKVTPEMTLEEVQ